MPTETVRVREATPDDLLATMNVLDGAGLAVDAGRVRARLAAGDALVAVAGDRVVGALVADPTGPPWEGGADDDGGPSGTADPAADAAETAADATDPAADAAETAADATDPAADAAETVADATDPAADAADQRADATHVVAVAVRRRRRGRGVGTALVETAAARAGRLTAAFVPDVRPFYESVGFAVTGEAPDGRLRAVRDRE